MRRRGARQDRIGRWGIILLILGVVRAPLPQADFHEIRHQDEPGQVCGLHDHLLRWHPDAGADQAVAVLHWHWWLPGTPGDPTTGDGPAFHAHAPDWSMDTPDDGPQIAPEAASRPLMADAGRPAIDAFTGVVDAPSRLGPGDTPCLQGECARVAPRMRRAALLQRWNC